MMTQRIHNHEIGYDSLPPNGLATAECFVQFVTDNPDEIYRFDQQQIELAEGVFVVGIDSWMDIELIPRTKNDER